MPAYEYVCRDCKKEFTVFLSIREYESKPKIKCPNCESDNVQRHLSDFVAKTSRKS
jgi:putative FmdB family regulatory protein